MATTAPIQIPITGDENITDLASPLYALSQFYRAFNSRNLPLMQENWEPSAVSSLDNPVGGVQRGWTNIRPIYERIFQSPATVKVEFFDYTIHDAAGKALGLAIRTTRIFRFRNGRWRQVHHHGSIDNPQQLAAYQSAVR
jgi:hypothetical protein